MKGRTDAALPASALRRSTALNAPRPPLATTSAAVAAGMKSASLASDEPVAVGHPVLRLRVDLGEGDLREEPLVERVLVVDPGRRLLLEEVAHQLVGQSVRRLIGLLGDRLLERAQNVPLDADRLAFDV